MPEISLVWQGQSIRIECPETIAEDIGTLFGALIADAVDAALLIRITEGNGYFSIQRASEEAITSLTRGDVAIHLMDVVITGLITDQRGGVILHAGAVARDGQVALVAGASGAGKSSLICWLVANGFDYVTDEIVLLRPEDGTVAGLPRAPVVKPGSIDKVMGMRAFSGSRTVVSGAHVMIDPPLGSGRGEAMPVALIVFPDFAPGRELSMAGLTAAATGLKLIGCNLNARNLRDGGFGALTRLARQAPALHLRYGHFEQLPGRIDTLIGLALDGTLIGEPLRRFLTGLRPMAGPSPGPGADAAA